MAGVSTTSATALLTELVNNFRNNDLAKLETLKNDLLGMFLCLFILVHWRAATWFGH